MRYKVLMAVMLLGALVALVPPPARAEIEILSYAWTPRYVHMPADTEVNLTAFVSAPEGLRVVSSTYCLIPSSTCLYLDMARNNATGEWWVVTNSVDPYLGASFEVTVMDMNYTIHYSGKVTIPYVYNLSLDASLSAVTVLPGTMISFDSTALYNENASLPMAGEDATVTLDGASYWSGLTGVGGDVAFDFTAPSVLGAHTVVITTTDGVFTETRTLPFTVTATPIPDFSALDASMPAGSWKTGDTITFTAVVKNVGNAAGTSTVTFSIDGTVAGTVSPSLGVDEQTTVTATWTATKGDHVLVVSVTGPGDTNAANAEQTLAFTVAPPATPGLEPILLIGLVAVVALLGRKAAHIRK